MKLLVGSARSGPGDPVVSRNSSVPRSALKAVSGALDIRRRIQDYITVTRAAEMLGVSASTLRNWDRSGKLKAARNPMNGYRLHRREDIARLLARIQRQTTGRG